MPYPSVPRPASPNALGIKKKQAILTTPPPPPPPPPILQGLQAPSRLLPSNVKAPPPPPLFTHSGPQIPTVANPIKSVTKARAVDSFLIGNYLPLTIFSIALTKAGVDITEHNYERFKYSASGDTEHPEKSLKEYKSINIYINELRNTIPRASSYEHDLSVDRFEKLVAINREWDSYIEDSKTKGDAIKNLYRGDTEVIKYSYDWLDNFISRTEHSTLQEEQILNINIKIAPIMSTAKTDNPMKHNYLRKKSVLWHITALTSHRGLEIGLYQEEEITFPMRNNLLVEKLIFLPKGISYRDDPITYGTDFKYIIIAKALP